MIIKDYVLLKLTDEPDSNGTVWAKDCNVHCPEKLSIFHHFDDSTPEVGNAFNIRKEQDSIICDIDVTHVSVLEIPGNVYAVVGCKVNKPEYDATIIEDFRPLKDIELAIVGLTCNPAFNLQQPLTIKGDLK